MNVVLPAARMHRRAKHAVRRRRGYERHTIARFAASERAEHSPFAADRGVRRSYFAGAAGAPLAPGSPSIDGGVMSVGTP